MTSDMYGCYEFFKNLLNIFHKYLQKTLSTDLTPYTFFIFYGKRLNDNKLIVS